MNNPLISIIVPIYNVEKYLGECLESLVNQDLREGEFEVIMVDDGSKDGSKDIASRYANRYSNFRLFTKENGGVSSARNLALNESKGDYIMFVDADDWITPNSLKKLLEFTIEQELDICFYNWVDECNGKTSNVLKATNLINAVTGKEYLETQVFYGSICIMLFKSELIKGNNICFIPIISGEDTAFAINAFEFSKKLYHYDVEAIYHYRRERKGSVTSTYSSEHYIRILNSRLNLLKWLNDRYPFNTKVKDYAYFVNRKYNGILMGAMCEMLPKAFPSDCVKEHKKFAGYPFVFYRHNIERGVRRIVFSLLQLTIQHYHINQFVYKIVMLFRKHLKSQVK
jgi:glycosyltransferase involved in cell wall biosynthesis